MSGEADYIGSFEVGQNSDHDDMSGSGGYRNYDTRVPPIYGHNSDQSPRERLENGSYSRGSHDNPAFVQYIEEPKHPRHSGGASNFPLAPIQPSYGVSNGRQAPAPPPRHMGLEGRSRKPWSATPMDTNMAYLNPGYSDSDQSSSQGAYSISGQGAIMGNMPVFSVMPEEEKKKRKGSRDADLYAIKPVEQIYPELPDEDGFGDRDLVTNPPEVLDLFSNTRVDVFKTSLTCLNNRCYTAQNDNAPKIDRVLKHLCRFVNQSVLYIEH